MIYPSCSNIISNVYVMHIGLPDRHKVANLFFPQAPLKKKFVCILLFCQYFGVFHKVVHPAASSNFTVASHVVFGLSVGFFLPVSLVQGLSNKSFPLQSFSWWLCSRKSCSISNVIVTNFRFVLLSSLICG